MLATLTHLLVAVELTHCARSVACVLVLTVARHGWLNAYHIRWDPSNMDHLGDLVECPVYVERCPHFWG